MWVRVLPKLIKLKKTTLLRILVSFIILVIQIHQFLQNFEFLITIKLTLHSDFIDDKIREAASEEDNTSSENINSFDCSELGLHIPESNKLVRPRERFANSQYLFKTNQDSTMFKSGY